MQILIVEDNKTSLMILARLVDQVEDCTAVTFLDPQAALAHALEKGADVILVDYVMPGMNGVEFVRALRAYPQTEGVPVIMVTSEGDRAVRQSAIAAGATDFVTKPVEPLELKARVRNLAALRAAHLEERDRSLWLRREVAKATRVIAEREHEIIMCLTRAAEYRDGSTGEHVERVANCARVIAEGMGLPAAQVHEIFLATPMHDIGKLAVPDAILKKPTALTPEETKIMQQHTLHGHEILSQSVVPLLRLAADIALRHHERVDGTGYPDGLAGSAIPLAARIVSVADVFDALTTTRYYRSPLSVEEARDFLLSQVGKQFDGECVDAFVDRWADIVALHGHGPHAAMCAA